ncbi:MAG: hypothetical protein JWM99_2656 [Verrucomicrobiales bacterium]|nr:hypothetical protein [Verrucomicrobiales bacterium]
MKMTENEVQQLADEALRRPLSAAEISALELYLSAHPKARSDWRESELINEGLRHLPDLQPSSNFTSQVLAEVRRLDREPVRHAPGRWFGSWRFSRGIAFGLVFFGVGTLFYHQNRVAERAEVAQTLVAVSDVARLINPAKPGPSMARGDSAMPNVQLLQDFDAIRSLRTVSVDLDLDLLKALQ